MGLGGEIKRRCQLAVVGAGPAGGNAALTASRAGLDVILLERDREVGRPLSCAEAISEAGLARFITPDPSFISTDIHAVDFIVGNNYKAHYRFPNRLGYVLDRPSFDRHVADLAVAAGANLHTQAYVSGIDIAPEGPSSIEVVTDRGRCRVTADFIIAADGVESMIGRMAGISTGLKLTETETILQYRVSGLDIDPGSLNFYAGDEFAPGGYLWVFPKSREMANIGLGLNPARYHGEDLCRLLDRFMAEYFPEGKIEFKSCGMVPKFVGFDILGRENLLLAGDAVRAVDSVAGAGIAKALHTGQMAARAVVAAYEEKLSRKEMLKRYRRMMEDEIGRDLRFCRKAYPLFRKFNDGDWESLVRFLKKLAESQKTGIELDPVSMVKTAFAGSPRLIRLVRHIF